MFTTFAHCFEEQGIRTQRYKGNVKDLSNYRKDGNDRKQCFTLKEKNKA